MVGSTSIASARPSHGHGASAAVSSASTAASGASAATTVSTGAWSPASRLIWR